MGVRSLFKGKTELIQQVLYPRQPLRNTTSTTTTTTTSGAGAGAGGAGSDTSGSQGGKKRLTSNKQQGGRGGEGEKIVTGVASDGEHGTKQQENTPKRKKQKTKENTEEEDQDKTTTTTTGASDDVGKGGGEAKVDKSSKEWTGEDLAAHARAAMKQNTTFTFGFDIQQEQQGGGGGQGPQWEAYDGEQADAEAEAEQRHDSRTIYVGGLPYEVQDVDIEQYFSEYGQVERIDKLTFSDSGRFNGIAFVTFDSGRSAKKALQANGQAFYEDERYLVVRKYARSGGGNSGDGRGNSNQNRRAIERTPGYHRVYVGNLPWNCTEDLLRGLFSGCKIKFLRMGTDAEGNFRGFAHLHFSSEEDMDIALGLNGEYVEGRQVKISPAMPPKR